MCFLTVVTETADKGVTGRLMSVSLKSPLLPLFLIFASCKPQQATQPRFLDFPQIPVTQCQLNVAHFTKKEKK